MHCLIAPTGAPDGRALEALDACLAQAVELPACRPDPLDLHTPAERWIGRLHGLLDDAALPLAAWQLGERQRPWAFLSPLHVQVESSQAVALPPAALNLSAQESQALFETLPPLFPSAEGWDLQWLAPLTWAVSHEQLAGLCLASVDRVVNRPLTPWLPQERSVRRWTNEVQMLWHQHPVNAARAAQRHWTVNSLWWWGAGRHAGEAPAHLQVHECWPASLDLPAGTVLALAGEHQVRSFEVGRKAWWQRRRAPRAAELWASL